MFERNEQKIYLFDKKLYRQDIWTGWNYSISICGLPTAKKNGTSNKIFLTELSVEIFNAENKSISSQS